MYRNLQISIFFKMFSSFRLFSAVNAITLLIASCSDLALAGNGAIIVQEGGFCSMGSVENLSPKVCAQGLVCENLSCRKV